MAVRGILYLRLAFQALDCYDFYIIHQLSHLFRRSPRVRVLGGQKEWFLPGYKFGIDPPLFPQFFPNFHFFPDDSEVPQIKISLDLSNQYFDFPGGPEEVIISIFLGQFVQGDANLIFGIHFKVHQDKIV